MRRIYLNRRTGEECLHIEILGSEIPDLLDDSSDFDAWPATLEFLDILKEAHELFTDEGAQEC